MYEVPSYHPIHYYRKEEALDNALFGCRHCHEKEDIEGCSSCRHSRFENLPHGQCRQQHPSMHMDNDPPSSVHVLSRPALAVIIPCFVLITPVPALWIP
jgi:hypothetical protein